MLSFAAGTVVRFGVSFVLGSLLVACSSGATGGSGAPGPATLGPQTSDNDTSSSGDDEDDISETTSGGNVESSGPPPPGCLNGVVEPGELCFYEMIYTDGIPGASWLAANSFDGDAALDLVVVAQEQGSVYMLFGDGTGTLMYDQFYDVGPQPAVLAVGAFDAWTLPDLVVTNVGDSSLSVLLNSGTGEFASATSVALPAAPAMIAVADFNADGLSDVAVGHDDDMTRVTILLGARTGLAQAGTVTIAGGDGLGLTAADVDGDAIVDLVAGVEGTNEVAVFHGDGAGGFAETARFPGGGDYPIAVRALDLYSDGAPEIVVGNRHPDEPGLGNLQVASFDGVGWVSSQLVLTEGAGAIDFGDFDADGDYDVVLSTLEGGSVQVFLNDGVSALSPGESYPLTAPSEPYGVVAADFDNNGAWDIATADPLNDRIAVLLAQP